MKAGPKKVLGKGSDVTRHISYKATLELWVRSGGRCVRCNKFLLEEPFFERPINLGERAHIAGWTDAPGSPRGDSSLPVSERNEPKNLVLLCQDCHTVIDNPATRDDYPEATILEIKRSHEERIHHLTGMSHDRETTVLRVFGMVRGSMPEMAREQAMQTVVDAAGRYARFPLAVDRYSIELDLAHLPDPEEFTDGSYWRIGRMKIDEMAKRIADAVHDKHIRHISVFALARIPLLVYLGFALDDKVPVDLYQKHRGADEGWVWPEDESPATFESVRTKEGAAGTGLVLVLSLSGTISLADLPAEVAEFPVHELRPVGVTPNPNLFRSRATLDAFIRTFQDLLAELERTDKTIDGIHLFCAAPITAAIACGRTIMRHVHPPVIAYDRIGDAYQSALTINERLIKNEQ